MPASSLLAPYARPGKKAVLSICVCVREREREREGGRGKERETERGSNDDRQ